jgi:hypothetical protein
VHNIIQSAGQAKLEPSDGLRRKRRPVRRLLRR